MLSTLSLTGGFLVAVAGGLVAVAAGGLVAVAVAGLVAVGVVAVGRLASGATTGGFLVEVAAGAGVTAKLPVAAADEAFLGLAEPGSPEVTLRMTSS